MKNMLLGISIFMLTISTLLVGEIPAELENYTQLDCKVRPMKRGPKNKRDYSVEAGHLHYPHHKSRPHQPVYEGTSTNWCGYAALTSLTKPKTGVVTSVSGTWTVPQLTATSSTTYCALWVGIDGYASSSVEQIGTEHDWSGGTQSNYAWFEMYPGPSYEIPGFPVDVGDSITGVVNYVSLNTFQLILTNHTKSVYYIVPAVYTKSTRAVRSSAEWIVEAPSTNRGVLALSDYGIASFTNCTATINGVTGPINSTKWANDPLTMITATGAVKSLPSSLGSGGESFTTTWKHQ